MKNLKTLLLLPGALLMQSVFGQAPAHIQLSDQFPTNGEKITITYDPAGTSVDGKKNIEAMVYCLGKKNSVADIDLKQDGKFLKGEVAILDSTKAFFIKISADDQIDNNDGKGYIYLVYKKKQPVEGAYATEAYIMSSIYGARFAKIKSDFKGCIELYKKEFGLYPKSKKEYEAEYYLLLSRNPEYEAEVTQKISALEKSSDEKDLRFAFNLLHATKQTKQSDSLANIIKTKFPNGAIVKDDLITSIYMEKDIHKKDSLFTLLSIKYPENASDKETSLDDLRAMMAWKHLSKNDMDGYTNYESQLKDKSLMANYLNDIAWNWAVAGDHLADAERLSKQSVDIMAVKINNPNVSAFYSPKESKKNAQGSYDASADTYAYVLWKENKSVEALPYMKAVYDRTTNEENSTEHYALILAGVGEYKKALDVISKGMMDGQTSDVLTQELKKDYIKVKGNDSGYPEYLASLQNVSKNKAMADLAKTMINQPAPTFALKDMDGKTVSLAELKGKVVIVDFWATWCGPCKASFPGMQLAVNKYKDDPNVKFLFVDCWENGEKEKYIQGVKKFIADNKYTFNVLIDEKGDDGRQSKVVGSYGVDGIPTKFIIDKNGNIRFKYVGYSGTPEKLVDEVTNMINMVGNPETTTAGTIKVSSSK